MQKNKLPDFAVHGTIQELIEIEMVLIMLGYDLSRELLNNDFCDSFNEKGAYIVLYEGGLLRYRDWQGGFSEKVFKASELDKIIKYVTTYK